MNASFGVTTSRPFLDRLFAGTLAALAARVDENGFCETSFGEENGVQSYGQTHFPRDAAEAAIALVETGHADAAGRIIDFNFRHIPEGQDYFPHILRPDGAVNSNARQSDTWAHTARALTRLDAFGVGRESLAQRFERLDAMAEALWRRHHHAGFGLLDSGNFNEQGFGGSREPLLDFFSNAASHAGCAAMAELAALLGDDAGRRRYEDRQAGLAEGIEAHLRDPATGVYVSAIRPDGTRLPLFNWLSIYCWRWYPGRLEAYDAAFDRLWSETANPWGPYTIPSGEPEALRLRTLGKFIGVMLAYAALSGRRERLEEMLSFIEATVRRPDNLWPEWWCHHAPRAEELPFFHDFFKKHAGVWTSYTGDPNGDYTVDSGNCEQNAVYVLHYLEDVLGARREGGHPLFQPPAAGLARVAFAERPFRHNGVSGRWSGEYERDAMGACATARITAGAAPALLRLPAASGRPEAAAGLKVERQGDEWEVFLPEEILADGAPVRVRQTLERA